MSRVRPVVIDAEFSRGRYIHDVDIQAPGVNAVSGEHREAHRIPSHPLEDVHDVAVLGELVHLNYTGDGIAGSWNGHKIRAVAEIPDPFIDGGRTVVREIGESYGHIDIGLYLGNGKIGVGLPGLRHADVAGLGFGIAGELGPDREGNGVQSGRPVTVGGVAFVAGGAIPELPQPADDGKGPRGGEIRKRHFFAFHDGGNVRLELRHRRGATDGNEGALGLRFPVPLYDEAEQKMATPLCGDGERNIIYAGRAVGMDGIRGAALLAIPKAP